MKKRQKKQQKPKSIKAKLLTLCHCSKEMEVPLPLQGTLQLYIMPPFDRIEYRDGSVSNMLVRTFTFSDVQNGVPVYWEKFS